MTLAVWTRIIVSLLGLVAFGLLVWFAGPLIGFGDVRPLDGFWARFFLIALVAALVIGLIARDVIRRRRQAAALEQAVAASQDGDMEALDERMKDALLTLKKASGSSADYLYDLPWYVIIGPPGSGKTTALVNSGLKFPLARGGNPAAIAGVGGTRYCDWWFTDGAVLIDTAGRYTTQDSDAAADRRSWTHFLDLLKKNRPQQPINGVLIAISIEDVLVSSPTELNAHADAIRARLTELHDSLKIDFPVYVVFTKMDLVAGFMEYFAHLNEAARRVVWGATFQTADKTLNMITEVPAEFEALVARLNAEIPDRLQEEATPGARVQLFGFPTQMEALKTPVVDFLTRIFEPTRYHTRATLRGFYFTSGTQQGTPIDQLIGVLARSFGANQLVAGMMSGSGKSFFLTDLITKVVIGEAAWVSTDRGAVRRTWMLRAAGFAAVGLLTAAMTFAWWVSYDRNAGFIAETNGETKSFLAVAAPVVQEPTVADRDLERIAPLLDKLRHLPVGYALSNVEPPVESTFGLSQWDRLNTGSEALYRTGLERLLRSRLVYRLEELLEANASRPEFLYEALKVYLILGGRQTMDEELLLSWIRRDLADNLYPGAAYARLRQTIEEHTASLLKLSADGAGPPVLLNEPLIQEAQRTLARLSLAQRAYQILKLEARASATRPDWTAAAKGGADARLVFAAAGRGSLDDVRVPYFYTYAGFHDAFIGRLREVARQVEEERWVLGEAGSQAAVTAQYESLPVDLLSLYSRDFVAAWNGALNTLSFQPLLANKPQYPALSAVSAVTSPLRQILESIRDETKLTRERPDRAQSRNEEIARGAAVKEGEIAARRALERVVSSGMVSRLEVALRAMEKPEPGSGAQPPGAIIEASFREFHMMLEGEPGRRPIDQVLLAFADINQNLRLLATNPNLVNQVNATLPGQIQTLSNASNLMPRPFSRMIQGAAASFETELTGTSVSQLLQDLRSQVTGQCQQIVANRYPFAKGSSRDVPMADFGRLFGPGGIMDRFFQQNLAPLVDTSRPEWAFRQTMGVARSLPPAALREFQRAAEIRETFFATGGTQPSFTMAITPVLAPLSGTQVRLDISGVAVVPQSGGGPTPVVWPGPAGLERAVLSAVSTGFFGGSSATPGPEYRGPWSFFRLLEAGSVARRGDSVVATFSFAGLTAGYQINVSSLRNPLTLKALEEFRCPGA